MRKSDRGLFRTYPEWPLVPLALTPLWRLLRLFPALFAVFPDTNPRLLLEIPGYVFVAGVSQSRCDLGDRKICFAKHSDYLLGADAFDLVVDRPTENSAKALFEVAARHGNVIDYVTDLNGLFGVPTNETNCLGDGPVLGS